MFEMIYIEESVKGHPRTRSICERYPHLSPVLCERYGEIFNKRAQNFRVQKSRPSLILAKKFDNFVLPTPQGYGIGGTRNFYFSHMLNCIFDCRYCFLQGMYSSAHYVLFVNFEDFEESIKTKVAESHQDSYFFSGYDCDSLALESITHFAEKMVPFFRDYPQAFLELRTKSTNIQFLLNAPVQSNCIVAFSLTPHEISAALEHKTPALRRRLEAIEKLQKQGWPIGLRFDPLIYCTKFQSIYRDFFTEVFSRIHLDTLHSVSLGPFRLPKGVYKNMVRLFPKEKLFAHSLEERGSLISYLPHLEKEMVEFCTEEVLKYIQKDRFFPCQF
jgi:spore photoproduct lyase